MCRLVFEKLLEHVPPLIQDRPVQAGFLPHHTTRIVNRAFGVFGHVFDFQVLENNRVKVLADDRSGIVVPILVDPGRAGMQFRNAAALLPVSFRPDLFFAQLALGLLDATRRHGKPDWQGFQLAHGRCNGYRHTAVNTDLSGQGPVLIRDFTFNIKRETDVPAIRLQLDCYVFQRAFQTPGIAIPHPPDPWQKNLKVACSTGSPITT